MAAKGRITTANLRAGMRIRVTAPTEAGNVGSTRVKRDSVVALVERVEVGYVPGGRQRRYFVHTTAGLFIGPGAETHMLAEEEK